MRNMYIKKQNLIKAAICACDISSIEEAYITITLIKR